MPTLDELKAELKRRSSKTLPATTGTISPTGVVEDASGRKEYRAVKSGTTLGDVARSLKPSDFVKWVEENDVAGMLGLSHEGADPSGPLQAVTQFITNGAPNKALRELATAETLGKMLYAYPKEFHKKLTQFVKNYPRVAAHMDFENIPGLMTSVAGKTEWNPAVRLETRRGSLMSQTDPTYTRVPVVLHDAASQPDPTTAYHEAVHVAQTLGAPKETNWMYQGTYDAIKNAAKKRGASDVEAGNFAYKSIPAEITARRAEQYADLPIADRRLVKQQMKMMRENAGEPETMMQLVESVAESAKKHEGDSSLLDKLQRMKNDRDAARTRHAANRLKNNP